VLLLTGPVGVGKSTIAFEAGGLLRDAGVEHAIIDLARIAESWPAPADDPWNERLVHRNLACMWSNFSAAGARRLVLCRVLEHRGLLRLMVRAVPGADVTVVRLRAPLAVVQERIRTREAGRDPRWFLDAAAYLVDAMENAPVEDFAVDNSDRPAAEVAAEILRRAGWVD
jgi:adenylylsulfate kinase